MGCVGAGEPDPDMAGTGILLAFMCQAFIALSLSLFLEIQNIALSRKHGEDLSWSERFLRYPASDDRRTCKCYADNDSETSQTLNCPVHSNSGKWREIAKKLLLAGSDSQSVIGISLLIAAISKTKTSSLYHLHIVYDTVNCTSITHAAAIASVFSRDMKLKTIRLFLIATFLSLYLAYIVLFGIRLSDWDNTVPGNCYDTSLISRREDWHPVVDQVYLGLTSLYLFIAFSIAISAPWPERRLEAFPAIAINRFLPISPESLALLHPSPYSLAIGGINYYNNYESDRAILQISGWILERTKKAQMIMLSPTQLLTSSPTLVYYRSIKKLINYILRCISSLVQDWQDQVLVRRVRFLPDEIPQSAGAIENELRRILKNTSDKTISKWLKSVREDSDDRSHGPHMTSEQSKEVYDYFQDELFVDSAGNISNPHRLLIVRTALRLLLHPTDELKSEDMGDAFNRRNALLVVSLQFPLHVYSVIALRVSNAHLLSSGAGGETQWSFGQIISVVVLAQNVLEFWKAYTETIYISNRSLVPATSPDQRECTEHQG